MSLKEIDAYAFYGCTRLTSLTIPDGITSIGHQAFYGCTRLTSLTLPNSLTDLGTDAFARCRDLTSVVLGLRLPPAFLAWVVGSSRSRDNWQLTSLKQLRNVLRLIVTFVVERRELTDDLNERSVFGCMNMMQGFPTLLLHH